jgi:autotransporter-associated beta strand protein
MGSSSADSATFAVYGATARGGNAGLVYFTGNSRAGMATITASGGRDKGEGASVVFSDNSHGDEAEIRLSGNATLDIGLHFFPGPVIGSVDGGGIIYLGGNRLTTGANDRNTTISALISDGGMAFGTGGSLKKVGTGDLTLTFANTYTGGTQIERGRLTVKNSMGSATGTGPVEVDGGALAGNGTIGGSVTVGAGIGPDAVIAPGVNGGFGTLTIEATLRFRSNAIYDWRMNSDRGISDQTVAAGVTIDDGATISLTDGGITALPAGTSFTVIDNTAATAIAGAFANLADGTTITLGSNTYEIAYEGGDGNDLTLTVVP